MYLSLEDQVYFDAVLTHQRRTKFLFIKEDYFTLENIETSDGFSFKEQNSRIEMDEYAYDPNSLTVSFNISELMFNGRQYSVKNRELVEQWHEDLGSLVQNTEYTGEGDSKKNAYVLLIMDTSLSLGIAHKKPRKRRRKLLTT